MYESRSTALTFQISKSHVVALEESLKWNIHTASARSDAWCSVDDFFVGDDEFSGVVADHFGFDFDGGEFFSAVDE